MQVGGSFQGQSARTRRRVTPPKEKLQRGDLVSDAGLRDCAVFLRGGGDRTPARRQPPFVGYQQRRPVFSLRLK